MGKELSLNILEIARKVQKLESAGLPDTYPATQVMMTGGGNVEDAIGDLTSGLTNLLKYKVFTGAASDTTNHLYNTGVPVSQYVCVGGCTPNHPNYCVEISNIEVSTGGYIRYRLYDVVANQVVSDNAAYMVYLVFVDTAMLSELVITP